MRAAGGALGRTARASRSLAPRSSSAPTAPRTVCSAAGLSKRALLGSLLLGGAGSLALPSAPGCRNIAMASAPSEVEQVRSLPCLHGHTAVGMSAGGRDPCVCARACVHEGACARACVCVHGVRCSMTRLLPRLARPQVLLDPKWGAEFPFPDSAFKRYDEVRACVRCAPGLHHTYDGCIIRHAVHAPCAIRSSQGDFPTV
jgi:hypothetical protein